MTAEVSARKTNKTRKCAPPHDYYYRWNERNLLSESSDSAYTVQYRYGADGQRALKFTSNIGRSTVYFNKMWQASDIGADWLQSKHIYLGEDRIATKYNSEGNENTQAERERVYYYHSDHFGSAQTVTNHIGQIHERLEYTPYGELWIDWRSADAPEDGTPFRFTGKELDPETGLYYFGARYLDPKTSRWLSGDPAVGDYLPSAPVNDEARKRNGNLPGQGGVFNYVNLHVYHYAGNNPVKYTDPDGRVDLRSIGGFFMKLILKPTPVGDAGNAESSRSLYNQQFQTEREKDNAYKRIIGAGGILPGWFGRAATVFAIVADAGWDESVVIYRDRTGFIAGAEQEISRIDELLEGLPASSNERNFLEEQKGLLRREIDENKKADEKLNREISFHYSGQVPDRRSAEPRGNPVDYQRHIEDL